MVTYFIHININYNMRIIFTLSFLVFLIAIISAQNLVSNPGFEKCDNCGQFGNFGVEFNFTNNSNKPVDWFGVTFGTSDIRQETPNSGRRHGGFYNFGKFEYLGNVLNEPLVAGAEYELRCFLGVSGDSEFSTDEIGFYFQQGMPIYQQAGPLKQLTPQLITPDQDFLPAGKYKEYKFTYIACGGEDHLVIGRFKELSKADTLFVGKKRSGSPIYCYTIIDDVELKLIQNVADLLPEKIEICQGSSQKIGLPAGAPDRQVLWSNGNTSDSIEIGDTDSIVWVEIKVRKDCPSIRDSVTIVHKSKISSLLPDEISICKGIAQNISVNPSGLSNPKWNNGNTTFTNNVSVPGWYVIIADSDCGLVTDSILVKEIASLKQDQIYTSDTCFSAGLKIEAQANPELNFYWSNGSKSNVLEVDSPGIYIVTVSNVCESVYDTVLVLDKLTAEEIFKMPNTFTPNGDQLNDNLKPVIDPKFENKINSFLFLVYNRWGKKVFETNNFREAWIPKNDDQMESYIYHIQANIQSCPGIIRDKKVGTVTLVR
jgi:hypothetical protein